MAPIIATPPMWAISTRPVRPFGFSAILHLTAIPIAIGVSISPRTAEVAKVMI
jgi:hypothetical protein